jgi:hypothetical protein
VVFRRLLVDARGTGEPFHIAGNDYGQLHHPLAQFRVSRNVALNAIARNRVVEFPALALIAIVVAIITYANMLF